MKQELEDTGTLTAERLGLIKTSSVRYNKYNKKWQCSFELNISGYEVKGVSREHTSFDEAADKLKELIAKAVVDFKEMIELKAQKNDDNGKPEN